MSGQWSMFVDDRAWDGSRRLFMRIRTHLSGQSFVGPLTLVTVPAGAPYDTPTMSETREDQEDAVGDVTGFLQAAMDEAWRLGMRPRAYADFNNELKAVRYHLEDMRALAKVPGVAK